MPCVHRLISTMAYIIGSDVVSYVIHGVPAASELPDELANDGLAMSVVTYLEALQSMTRSPISDAARQRFDGLLSRMPVSHSDWPRRNGRRHSSSSCARTVP